MKLVGRVLLTATVLALAGPVFAQSQASDEQEKSAAEQARIKSARENTKMTYTDEARYASASIVDPKTQQRNNYNSGSLDISMASGH